MKKKLFALLLCTIIGLSGCGRDVSSRKTEIAETETETESIPTQTISVKIWNKDSFDTLYEYVGSDMVNDVYQLIMTNKDGYMTYNTTEEIYDQVKNISSQFSNLYRFDITAKPLSDEAIKTYKETLLNNLVSSYLMVDMMSNNGYEDQEAYLVKLCDKLGLSEEDINHFMDDTLSDDEEANLNWKVIDKLGPEYYEDTAADWVKELLSKKTLEEKKAYFEELDISNLMTNETAPPQEIEKVEVYDKNGNLIGTMPGEDIQKMLDDNTAEYENAIPISQSEYAEPLNVSTLELDQMYRYELKAEPKENEENSAYYYAYHFVNDRKDSYLFKLNSKDPDESSFSYSQESKPVYSVSLENHKTLLSGDTYNSTDTPQYFYIKLESFPNDKALLDRTDKEIVVYASKLPKDGDVFNYGYLYNDTSTNLQVYADDEFVNVPINCGLNLFGVRQLSFNTEDTAEEESSGFSIFNFLKKEE